MKGFYRKPFGAPTNHVSSQLNTLSKIIACFFLFIFIIFAVASGMQKEWVGAILNALSAAAILAFMRGGFKGTYLSDGRILSAGIFILFMMSASFTKPPQTVNYEALQQQAAIRAKVDFANDPSVVIKEIADLIERKDFETAKRQTDRLIDSKNQEIIDLNKKASAGVAAILAAREADAAKAQEAASKERALIGRALSDCKSRMANELGAGGSGMIPDVENNGSKGEFLFGWPRGLFQITTQFGTVGLSASCGGTLKPMRIKWITVNGRDLL